jgi:Sec-independent protein secretion pathway component TatC
MTAELRARIHQPKGASGAMPLLDHLEELGWRFVRSVVALVVATGVGIHVAARFDLLGLLKRPLGPYIGGEQYALADTVPVAS